MLRAVVNVIAASVLVASSSVAQAADPAPKSWAPQEATATKVEREATVIAITTDFARVLTFNRSARTVIIGNPSIIDGTLNDDRTIVLSGKAVGTTNIIILGEGGEEIANLAVDVTGNERQLTTVYQGAEQMLQDRPVTGDEWARALIEEVERRRREAVKPGDPWPGPMTIGKLRQWATAPPRGGVYTSSMCRV